LSSVRLVEVLTTAHEWYCIAYTCRYIEILLCSMLQLECISI